MNNKAFTLVELIALIVILLTIFLFAFPNFTNMLKRDNGTQYKTMVDDLCTAGKTYMYSNMDAFPNLSVAGSIIELKISELITYGNVDKDLVNPKTKSDVKEDILEYIVNDDFTLKCEYKEGN